MKIDKGLKIALLILLIILVSIISFVGIYVQDKNNMKNILKDYSFGMDLKGNRSVRVVVDDSKNTVYYDKDGNIVDKEAKDGTKEEVPVNKEEVLNKENYLLSKEIIEKRFDDLGVPEYQIRQNEKTGQIVVSLPENSATDLLVQYIYSAGKFTIEDEEGNVLLDNSNLKSVSVGYASETNGTRVYLNIDFTEESVEKLREMSTTYVSSKDEEGKDTTKNVTIKVDDGEIMTTSFSEEITNGTLSLAVGSASTDNTTINSYLQEASNLAILLNNGKLPIVYKVSQNRYMKSDITAENLQTVAIVVAAVALVACIILIVLFKKNAVFASISYMGYVAVLLLALRYANVVITLEGLFGIVISMLLNYIFILYLLRKLKGKEDTSIEKKIVYDKSILEMLLILVPALIVGVTLCFTNWLSMYSFGAIIFWGILILLIYNTIVTRTLIVLSSKK